MGFYKAEDYVAAFGAQQLRIFKHPVRLADSNGSTHIYLESSPL
jgi:hypothetical protein